MISSKTSKIIISEKNLLCLNSIVDRAKSLGVKKIKITLPFKLVINDNIPFLAEAVSNIKIMKEYARQLEIDILSGYDSKDNPYFPKEVNFFDMNTVNLKINLNLYKTKPKFSIIIPTFNRKTNLKFVLHNFFKQDYSKDKYEIIVVDDGSTDGTLESIKKMKPTCNFKYFYWPRKNLKIKKEFRKWAKFYNRVGLARNIGINNAKGEIILFNDSDILVEKDCLKKHKKYHDRYSNAIVRGFRMFLPKSFQASLKKIQDVTFLKKTSLPEKKTRFKEMYCGVDDLSKENWSKVWTINLSLRREFIKRIGGFSKDFVFWGFEDVEFGYRLGKQEKMKLVYDDQIKLYHLYHRNESGDNFKQTLAFWIGVNIFYRKYLDEEIYQVFRYAIMEHLDSLILNQ